MEERIIAIDERYLMVYGDQIRVAVTSGPNVAKKMYGGALASTEKNEKFVLGLHNVLTKGSKLCIVDSWLGSFETNGISSEEEIINRAREILTGIPDDEYRNLCGFCCDINAFGKSPVEQWQRVKEDQIY